MAILLGMELIIPASGLEQCLVTVELRNGAILDRYDPVAWSHCGQSMRNDENSAPLSDLPEGGLDDFLALGVKCAGRFVENQNARIGDQCVQWPAVAAGLPRDWRRVPR